METSINLAFGFNDEQLGHHHHYSTWAGTDRNYYGAIFGFSERMVHIYIFSYTCATMVKAMTLINLCCTSTQKFHRKNHEVRWKHSMKLLIGACLSEPHINGTAVRENILWYMYVCMVRPSLTVYTHVLIEWQYDCKILLVCHLVYDLTSSPGSCFCKSKSDS